MTTTAKKIIQQTLDEIDNVQAEKVLDYMRSLVQTSPANRPLKREALQQIQRALSNDKSVEYFV